jgi:hypothetical protein
LIEVSSFGVHLVIGLSNGGVLLRLLVEAFFGEGGQALIAVVATG